MSPDDLTGSSVGRGTNGATTSDGGAFTPGRGGTEATDRNSAPSSWTSVDSGRSMNGATISSDPMGPGGIPGNADLARARGDYGPVAQQGATSGMDPSVTITVDNGPVRS
jgi:hypothetical protein